MTYKVPIALKTIRRVVERRRAGIGHMDMFSSKLNRRGPTTTTPNIRVGNKYERRRLMVTVFCCRSNATTADQHTVDRRRAFIKRALHNRVRAMFNDIRTPTARYRPFPFCAFIPS